MYSCEIVYRILLFDIDYIFIIPRESGSRCTGIVLETSVIVPAAPKFYQLKGRFYSILKMTSHSLDYSCILFRYFRSVEKQLTFSQSTSGAHRFAFSLFGSVWELLEGSVLAVQKS